MCCVLVGVGMSWLRWWAVAREEEVGVGVVPGNANVWTQAGGGQRESRGGAGGGREGPSHFDQTH